MWPLADEMVVVGGDGFGWDDLGVSTCYFFTTQTIDLVGVRYKFQLSKVAPPKPTAWDRMINSF